MKKTLHLVAGARPNFMKIAPIVRALDARRDAFRYQIVHTGQHYDREMSDVFFEELGIPKPDFHLEAGGGSHAEQTAKIMVAYEKICQAQRPDCTLVVGDVNSTLACSIVAKKLQIPVAHVEAGLRSGDMRMPEEVNRLVTDSISDWFFVTEPSGRDNLLREGKPADRVFFVGHVMVDNLLYQREQLERADRGGFESETLKARLGRYGVVTLHRPSNVDHPDTLAPIAGALREISAKLPLVFPVHPRTRGNLEKFGLDLGPGVILTKPLSYMDFLNLWKDASLILTDSGGLQEETTALGIPCLTLRENTERPVTVDEGTNTMVGCDPTKIVAAAEGVLAGKGKAGQRPQFWDGKAAERIVNELWERLR
ncbi:non-hydrolyzing UDP-N-acetylglucosamine 2-epimerase [Zeimonas arvi]|uniref:UDP-N-acetylglucosamine 2-epimerase (Non-hydrolyzing) n=1 Tax=Zeimonas arvi TaxID=2498847 RepID=A0A5C8NYM0_9BURK|nr:UDP-N-acetylglucosamine 2-epimerase (non-hydrolyzing) [Zeimonas arvi]TXL66359.1 UDP-N-acetylglucosamine 2-epimerase (non-hydrolyzing) [Zeimonas arvi]